MFKLKINFYSYSYFRYLLEFKSRKIENNIKFKYFLYSASKYDPNKEILMSLLYFVLESTIYFINYLFY